jgi:hypothetical protein
LKELEYKGYQYEGAESSFELEIMKMLGKYEPSFELTEFKVIVSVPNASGADSTAVIKIRVDGEEEISADEGNDASPSRQIHKSNITVNSWKSIRNVFLTSAAQYCII